MEYERMSRSTMARAGITVIMLSILRGRFVKRHVRPGRSCGDRLRGKPLRLRRTGRRSVGLPVAVAVWSLVREAHALNVGHHRPQGREEQPNQPTTRSRGIEEYRGDTERADPSHSFTARVTSTDLNSPIRLNREQRGWLYLRARVPGPASLEGGSTRRALGRDCKPCPRAGRWALARG